VLPFLWRVYKKRMATLRQIAKDPRKALANLEKDLGVRPGDLVREIGGSVQI
jgi:hypothetical protein